jgi:hypothetical protein
LSIDFQLRITVDQRPSGIVNHQGASACGIDPIGDRQANRRGGRRVVGNVKRQPVAGVYDVADLPANNLRVNRGTHKRQGQTGGAVGKREIPVSLLIPNQLTGKDGIVEPAYLSKRILVKNRYGFTLPFLQSTGSPDCSTSCFP